MAPFNNHWYAGAAPPLVAVAVKLTDVPAQIVVAVLATILMVGTVIGLTFMLMAFEVAVGDV